MTPEGNTPVAYSEDRPSCRAVTTTWSTTGWSHGWPSRSARARTRRCPPCRSPSATACRARRSCSTVTHDAGGQSVTRSCVARIAPEPSAVPVFPASTSSCSSGSCRSSARLGRPRAADAVVRAHGRRRRLAVLRDGAGGRRGAARRAPLQLRRLRLYDASPEDQARLQRNAVGILAGIHAIERPARRGRVPGARPPGETALARHLADLRAYYDWVAADLPSPAPGAGVHVVAGPLAEGGGPAAISGATRASATCCGEDFAPRPSSTGRWRRSPPVSRPRLVIFIHQFFEDIAIKMGLDGMPHFLRLDDVAATYTEMTGYEPIDLEWFIAYSAVRHGGRHAPGDRAVRGVRRGRDARRSRRPHPPPGPDRSDPRRPLRLRRGPRLRGGLRPGVVATCDTVAGGIAGGQRNRVRRAWWTDADSGAWRSIPTSSASTSGSPSTSGSGRRGRASSRGCAPGTCSTVTCRRRAVARRRRRARRARVAPRRSGLRRHADRPDARPPGAGAGPGGEDGHQFATRLGTAADLGEEDDSADAVLLMGPLYHLIDPDDRIDALPEARRCCVPVAGSSPR